MPSWEVRRLRADDAQGLSAVLTSVSIVGPQVDRGHDPFAHPRSSGDCVHVGGFFAGRLVAVAGAVVQSRHVAGRPTPCVYLFDVRVAEPLRRTLLLLHVLRSLREAVAGEEWCHAVVLEGHPMVDRLARGAGWFGPARCLGRTRHVAWPIFLDAPRRLSGAPVFETDADEAARAYFEMAPRHDLSPADESRFRASGRYFVRRRGARVTAVGKLVDESPRRRILRDGSLGRTASMLGWVARARGYAALPERGGPMPLTYLSSYASEDASDTVGFAIAAAAAHRGAPYVCFGVDAEAPIPSHPLAVSFVSRTYGYGRLPPQLTLRSHELTWM
jgi:hypothetical protein